MIMLFESVLIDELDRLVMSSLILNKVVDIGLIRCLNCWYVILRFLINRLFLKNNVVVIISIFVLIVFVISIVIKILINLNLKIFFCLVLVLLIICCCVRVECK